MIAVANRSGFGGHDLWARICAYEGEVFYQKRGQPFTHWVIGSRLLPSTTNRMLPRSNFEIVEFTGSADRKTLQGSLRWKSRSYAPDSGNQIESPAATWPCHRSSRTSDFCSWPDHCRTTTHR
jgi:hypothetical protein